MSCSETNKDRKDSDARPTLSCELSTIGANYSEVCGAGVRSGWVGVVLCDTDEMPCNWGGVQ